MDKIKPDTKALGNWLKKYKGDYVICVYESRYKFISMLKTTLNSFDLARYIWGLDEGKSPFQKEEEKPLTKTMTGQKPTTVKVNPKIEEK